MLVKRLFHIFLALTIQNSLVYASLHEEMSYLKEENQKLKEKIVKKTIKKTALKQNIESFDEVSTSNSSIKKSSLFDIPIDGSDEKEKVFD